MPRHAAVTTLVAFALVLTGCGAKERSSGAPAISGAEVFARECSMCHTLGAETGGRGPVGGSLRGYGLSATEVERLTRVMPVAQPLSEAELRAVSGYVAGVERRQAARP